MVVNAWAVGVFRREVSVRTVSRGGYCDDYPSRGSATMLVVPHGMVNYPRTGAWHEKGGE